MARYRAGVIGLNLGRMHVDAYAATDAIELVALADIDARALASIGDAHDVPGRYADYREMLAHEDLDIVSVTTPQGLHASMVIEAAAHAPKAILCEKAMANDMAGALAMLAACDRAGVKLAIGHQRRQLPMWTKARELITGGAIGKPRICSVGVDEGGLLNQGSHLIDLTRYALGDPAAAWVVAQIQRDTDRYERGAPIEDLCMGLVGFDDGTRFVFDSDIENNRVIGRWSFTFSGDAGVLHMLREPGADGSAFRLQLHAADQAELDIAPDEMPDVDAFHAQVDELVAWIDGDVEHRADAHQIIKTHEIMMAFYESARIRGLVQLPLQTMTSPLAQMISDDHTPLRHPGPYDIRRPGFLPPRESVTVNGDSP